MLDPLVFLLGSGVFLWAVVGFDGAVLEGEFVAGDGYLLGPGWVIVLGEAEDFGAVSAFVVFFECVGFFGAVIALELGGWFFVMEVEDELGGDGESCGGVEVGFCIESVTTF